MAMKYWLIIGIALIFVVSAVLIGVLTNKSSNQTLPANAVTELSSSTTYYKNGSSYYTLSSTQQHYKCTNSSHSGTNDYTSSSVSGTCYTSTGSTSYTTRYFHNLRSATMMCTSTNPIFRGGATGWYCDYCGTLIKSVVGGATGSYTSTTECSMHAYCMLCKKYFKSLSIASSSNCSSNSTATKICNNCGGLWDSCSCTVTYSHDHSLSASYVQYTYTNIDTGGTTTSTSSYSTATGYTVSYNANSGSGTMNSQYFLHGRSQALRTNTFTRSCYTFKGWATSSTGSVTYTNGQSISLSSGSNMTLYAVWSAYTYTVKYNANGGSGTTANSSHTYGVAKNLTTNGYTKTGYAFLGWSTSSTATSATYTNGQSVSNLTTTNNGVVTLYAVWKANSYTVAYNSNGGLGSMLSSTHTYGVAKALTTNSYTKTGYKFLGWSTSNTATTATYTDGQNVSNLTSTNGETITLYAVWTQNSFEVNLDNQSATVSGSTSVTVVYGSTMPSINLPTRSGYKFGGYYTQTNGSGTQYYTASGTSAQTYNLQANLTLYAYWITSWYSIESFTGSSNIYKVYDSVDKNAKFATLIITPATGNIISKFSFDNATWYDVDATSKNISVTNEIVSVVYSVNGQFNSLVLEFKGITTDTLPIYLITTSSAYAFE